MYDRPLARLYALPAASRRILWWNAVSGGGGDMPMFPVVDRGVDCRRGTAARATRPTAVSVAVAALTAAQLRSVQVEDSVLALRVVVDHRDYLIKQHTQTVNRLHVLLTWLIDGVRRPG